eukprot:CAMPEP_0173416742 /NCGR_PEP_ID=MMETSP1356-20130122/85542_1 /TAXON_ID=77927 ORGANISM="Hemiselmis virescens, Strain PCC157" /NCGR_SAMPLE_ID=MMETSP1356 /ASSEMBLY_ACC=CAM_ASM_000847 /LENGTH=93 /DNA_ID=CAMNT_0014379057 /DNA_START=867 /DNA_END=1145 /DNA_ORIENTATION=+
MACWASRPSQAATAIDFATLIKMEKAKLAAKAARNSAPSLLLEFPRRTLAGPQARVAAAPPCVWYVADFVSEEEEERLLRAVGEDPLPWTDLG